MRFIWIFICCGMVGCHASDKQKEYSDFINDPANRIVQKIKLNEVEMTMKFQPEAYRAFARKDTLKEEVAGAAKDSLYYFNVRIDKVDGEKPAKEKLLYLDFDMQKDFLMATGADSIPPLICQKIENGKGGSYEYMLVFENPKEQQDFTVVYNDKIFGIGTIAFVYKNEDIRRIPVIKNKDQE